MSSLNVNEEVEVPHGVRVTDSPPEDEGHVNVFRTRSGSWQAQHWTTVDGHPIADYGDERTAKRNAIKDALLIAQAKGIPFVQQVREENNAMQVDSTIHE